jgi:TonB family protein
VTEQGALYLGGRRVEEADLEAALGRALLDAGSSTLLLRLSQSLPADMAAKVMTAAKRAGARNLAVLSQPPAPFRADAPSAEPGVPDVIPGQAQVRGTLDKEIIRRVIRRHIDDVKACYELELASRPVLGGRVTVQFTIAATGQVVASVLQASTLGSPRVENCIVQTVRRWEFPKPLGGGIVIVSYPFVLTPAGGIATQVEREVRARMSAVRACHARRLPHRPDLSGSLVVRWMITETGTASDVAVERDGVGDGELAACVTQLISRWRFPAPAGGPVSVSHTFAFPR